jgi:hypothetical protein
MFLLKIFDGTKLFCFEFGAYRMWWAGGPLGLVSVLLSASPGTTCQHCYSPSCIVCGKEYAISFHVKVICNFTFLLNCLRILIRSHSISRANKYVLSILHEQLCCKRCKRTFL